MEKIILIVNFLFAYEGVGLDKDLGDVIISYKRWEMANRAKTKRNNKILELWDTGKGWRQQSIANMYKMKLSAV